MRILRAAVGLFAVAISCLVAAQDLNTLNNQFHTAWRNGDYKEALRLAERMRALAEADANTSPHNLAGCLANLADVYAALGRPKEALPLHERALEIRRRAFGDNDLQTAHSHTNLAEVLRQLRRQHEAEAHFRRALEIRQRRLPANDADLGAAYANLALIHTEMGQLRQAEEGYAKALAVYRQALPGDHPMFANAVNGYGCVLVEQGRYAEAETQFQWALAVCERKLGREHPETAMCLHNLGVVLAYTGRLAEAEALLKQALTIRQVKLHPDHLFVADTLNALGIVYVGQGRLEDGEKRYQRALAIYDLNLGPGHGASASIRNNLALVQKRRRKFDVAEPQMREALAAAERTRGADHPEVAAQAMNLAGVLLNLKRYDEADALYRRAEAIFRRAFPSGHPDLGDLLHNLSDLRVAQGRPADAEPLLTEALHIHALGASSPRQQFLSYQSRAALRQQQGRAAEALHDWEQAMQLAEQQRSFISGHDADRAAAFLDYLPAFEQAMLLYGQQGDLPQAWKTMERARARALIDQLQLQGVDLLAGVPGEQAVELRRRQAENLCTIAELRQQWEKLAGDETAADEERARRTTALLQRLKQAQDEHAEIYREMRAANPACKLAGGQRLLPCELAEAQHYVDQQQAMLLAWQLGREGLHLFCVAKERTPRLVTLTCTPAQAAALNIPAGADPAPYLPEAISSEIAQIMMLLSQPASAAQAGRRLETLWELLLPREEREAILSGQFQRLIIVPDGALGWLPWETLVLIRGQEPEYLLDRGLGISYVPSGTVLRNLLLRSSAVAGGPPLLTVGDPAYDAADHGSQRSAKGRFLSLSGRLNRLPHSRLESQWVAEVFRQNGLQSVQLLDSQASEAAVRRQLRGRAFIHLACHGLVDRTYGNLFGALALAPGAAGSADPRDDGFLTLAELYELDLGGCELAILSACQTNYGPQQRGEGVLGLSRGCLAAGARRTVASNWLVDDEAAAALMSQFAREIAAAQKSGHRCDYAGALARAKRWVRQQEKWRSPYFWAPFVLVGAN